METDINRAVFGFLALAAGLVQWEERHERRWRTDLSACVWITVWPCRLRSQSVFLRPENTHGPQTHGKLSAVQMNPVNDYSVCELIFSRIISLTALGLSDEIDLNQTRLSCLMVESDSFHD